MDYTLHVKIPQEWRDGLNELAEAKCGTTHGEARLAIREHLERTGLLAERHDGRQTELANQRNNK